MRTRNSAPILALTVAPYPLPQPRRCIRFGFFHLLRPKIPTSSGTLRKPMNGFPHSILFVAFIALCSCSGKPDPIQECSVAQSEKVYAGKFDPAQIESVGVIASNQKSVYPIPDIRRSASTTYIANPDFNSKFKESLPNASGRDEPILAGFDRGFHIFVFFRSGQQACLFGRVTSSGFMIEPMFTGNSYARINNSVYNLFASRSGEFKSPVSEGQGKIAGSGNAREQTILPQSPGK